MESSRIVCVHPTFPSAMAYMRKFLSQDFNFEIHKSDQSYPVSVMLYMNVKPECFQSFENIWSRIMIEMKKNGIECLKYIIKPPTGTTQYVIQLRFANLYIFESSMKALINGKIFIELTRPRDRMLEQSYRVELEFFSSFWLDSRGVVSPKHFKKYSFHDFHQREVAQTLEWTTRVIHAQFIHPQGMDTPLQSHYWRNNKKGGHKNLRCFPACSNGKHIGFGFCGSPINVVIQLSRLGVLEDSLGTTSNDAVKELVSFCRFVTFGQRSHDIAASGPNISVGDWITEIAINELVRTRMNPLAPWCSGVLKGVKCSSDTIRAVYSYNDERMAWHYGWTPPRRQTRSSDGVQHAVEVVFFYRVKGNLQCVHIIRSNGFCVHSNRRRANPNEESTDESCNFSPTKRSLSDTTPYDNQYKRLKYEESNEDTCALDRSKNPPLALVNAIDSSKNALALVKVDGKCDVRNNEMEDGFWTSLDGLIADLFVQ